MDSAQPRDAGGRFGHKHYAEASQHVVEACDPLEDLNRACAADLDDIEARRLAQPSNPVGVRLALAHRFDPDTIERAALDPSPVVRAHALESPMLRRSSALRLARDPMVQQARAVLGFRAHVA